MREFTVIFRSVQELSEFMALANQQPFDVLFVRAGGVSNAKSMFSCLSLQLNSPQMVRILWMCRSSARICSRIWRRARRLKKMTIG